MLHRPQPVSPDDDERHLAALRTELARGRDVSAESDARCAVLLINPQALDGSFSERSRALDARITALCDELGLDVFDPLPDLDHAAGGKARMRLGTGDGTPQARTAFSLQSPA